MVDPIAIAHQVTADVVNEPRETRVEIKKKREVDSIRKENAFLRERGPFLKNKVAALLDMVARLTS
jgi:hypothetical protein